MYSDRGAKAFVEGSPSYLRNPFVSHSVRAFVRSSRDMIAAVRHSVLRLRDMFATVLKVIAGDIPRDDVELRMQKERMQSLISTYLREDQIRCIAWLHAGVVSEADVREKLGRYDQFQLLLRCVHIILRLHCIVDQFSRATVMAEAS